jgi:hypothetical protein
MRVLPSRARLRATHHNPVRARTTLSKTRCDESAGG